MRKILSGAFALISYSSLAAPAFAAIDAGVKTPAGATVIPPETTIGQVVGFLVAFIIVIAFLAALLFIVIGAFQWITSGGDKQKVADARNHIIAAVIGLIIIALSFVIINVVLQALGLGDLRNLKILTLPEFK
ncbi:MAG: hypothetical protein A3C30_03860 [Candidatus Levybacteria bacterium RIFCSPHIGHO2_02_FULL_40_18]|nr:MAG: hypothetical protein A2869_00480 [Candidatus Levybacteria bacterium RIFCSPHIGHO2_01_FULL_40_58]OGH26221.1 MAG: hypothetical protein A3C30_03860 [Candidatus Levybacteria bacterium RIFCSPHIGHO2_02_FULL_40_18]OGH31473.1 MAG: hypothetical protein A3E43_02900 [Candidatus Levybacteria bacterium RIFCSPHIGHO2_12_FULL_40_31]OGH40113.1 MAG: hypothetical protein A2894_04220 [Candidatus Levybacteria bacterium RIFCSPLOWO2_01_FULL_40_64]OGH49066.1 MAG: hypothetical protein A3I54_00645 [Candidatus Lev